jgi:hypothetical protein
MAVVSNTASVTPQVGVQLACGIIAGGPFDNVSVYFTGGLGGSGPIALRLHALVNGLRTLIATKNMQGTSQPTLVDFELVETNDETESVLVNAGGASYVVTVQDLSTGNPANTPPRQPVTITVAGVDEFDTAPDAQQGAALAAAPGGPGTLPVIAGYAQQMDVAIDQANLPAVTVQVLADCGPGSVRAVVAQAPMQGKSANGIASVFRNLRLPVATEYIVQFINNGAVAVTVVLTATTYSESVAAGGVVVLNGDVIGPSNANTVIKWSNVPLLRLAPGGFDPANIVDAVVPIYDAALGEWRALNLSGGATMNNSGVVTINAASITLGGDVTGPANANTVVRWENQPLDPVTMAAPAVGNVPTWDGAKWVAQAPGGAVVLVGNANGPSGANTVQYFPTSTTDADVNVGAQPHPHGLIYEGLNGLTANRTVTLPAAPTSGDEIIVKDEDGSLNAFNIIINGNGKTIDGAATYTMTLAQNGSKGSVTLLYTGTAWALV